MLKRATGTLETDLDREIGDAEIPEIDLQTGAVETPGIDTVAGMEKGGTLHPEIRFRSMSMLLVAGSVSGRWRHVFQRHPDQHRTPRMR